LRRLCRRLISDRGPVLCCAFFRLEAAFRSDVITLFRGLRELPLDDVRSGLESPRKRLAVVLDRSQSRHSPQFVRGDPFA
jgi:hypothetical protein